MEHEEWNGSDTFDPDWIESFLKERENSELNWCLMYEVAFRHGSDGHNRMLLVAKLYSILETAWHVMNEEQRENVKEVIVGRSIEKGSAE